MTRKALFLLAAASLAVAAPSFSQAAPGPGAWLTIEQREANLNARIDAGLRNRSLTQAEAASLRQQLHTLEVLEANYRTSGRVLDQRERDDLDRRFDQLSANIRDQATDDQRGGPWNLPGWNGAPWMVGGRWQTIAQRQDDFNRIIEPGIRSGRISRSESTALHNEFNRLLNLERRYMPRGLSASERADLDRQFNILVQRVRAEAMDNNNGRGRGNGPGRY